MDILIQGGTLATDGVEMKADIGITDGVVSCIGNLAGMPADEVIDASGRLVLPGFVDIGVCPLRDGSNTPPSESLVSMTRQAAAGGVTTVVFATDLDPEKNFPEVLAERVEQDLDHSWVDFGYHLYLPSWNDRRRRQLGQAPAAGVAGVWIPRMGFEGHPPHEALVFAALRELPEDSLVVTTPFDAVYDRFIRSDMHQRRTVAPSHAGQLLPEWLEASLLASFGAQVRQARCRGLMLGLTCTDSLEELSRLRESGGRVSAGTSLAHLALSSELLEEQTAPVLPPTWPPLRGRSEVQAAWSALEDGLLSLVSSMHCPRTNAETAEAQKDVAGAATGVAGLEHFGSVLHSEGVAKWRLSPASLSLGACADPAKLAGLYPRKGALQVGSDADVVILNPTVSGFGGNRVAPEEAYSPYANMLLGGAVEMVFLRGGLLFHSQEFHGSRRGVWLDRRQSLK